MVWKQDLAKLKHAFREAGGPPPPAPKPKLKPLEAKDLKDEDAVFLAAMGTPAAPVPKVAVIAPIQPPLPVEAPVSFEEGLADLRGLKPLARNLVVSSGPANPVPVKKVEAALPPDPEPPVSVPLIASSEPSSPSKLPIRIQLAAGMAVEVDAFLDLRGHSAADALGRIHDRLEDGALLGWRTLHLVLGEDPALHEALLAFLGSAAAARIGRYAQAPIPMGGAQAWVLYY